MKWLFILLLAGCFLASVQAQEADSPKTRCFNPRYFKHIERPLVDSALANVATEDELKVETAQNEDCSIRWVYCHDKIVTAVINRADGPYLVYSHDEYSPLFGLAVRFDLWNLSVAYRSK